jgi:hypothetical protein
MMHGTSSINKWMTGWQNTRMGTNPPYITFIPTVIAYMRQCIQESAYVSPQTENESRTTYKLRVYRTLLYYVSPPHETKTMRINKLWPAEDWDRIWRNLHATPVSDNYISIWYSHTRYCAYTCSNQKYKSIAQRFM